jgi:hypothetical protein
LRPVEEWRYWPSSTLPCTTAKARKREDM